MHAYVFNPNEINLLCVHKDRKSDCGIKLFGFEMEFTVNYDSLYFFLPAICNAILSYMCLYLKCGLQRTSHCALFTLCIKPVIFRTELQNSILAEDHTVL